MLRSCIYYSEPNIVIEKKKKKMANLIHFNALNDCYSYFFR